MICNATQRHIPTTTGDFDIKFRWICDASDKIKKIECEGSRTRTSLQPIMLRLLCETYKKEI